MLNVFGKSLETRSKGINSKLAGCISIAFPRQLEARYRREGRATMLACVTKLPHPTSVRVNPKRAISTNITAINLSSLLVTYFLNKTEIFIDITL